MGTNIGQVSRIGALNRIRIAAYCSLVCLFVFSFLTLFPIASGEERASAATGTSTDATTSLTISNNNDIASLNLTPNSAAGTFASSNANGTAVFNVTPITLLAIP